MTSSLDHLEKTFSELYRKEIDQEENVWRTLPFFAAAVALQFGVIAGMLPKPGTVPAGFSADVKMFVLFIIVCDCFTFSCLIASIYSRRNGYEYLPPEPEILQYGRSLDAQQRALAALASGEVFDASARLKEFLAASYAVASHNNRRVNQRGVRMRKFAGVSILISMLLTLALFARIVLFVVW